MSAAMLESLTPREREVLTMVAQGLSLPEIAEKLHRSLKTIETHRLSVGRKLGASNRVELTRIALSAGLAPLEVTVADTNGVSERNAKVRKDLEGRARALQCFQQINDEVFSATGPAFLRRLVLSLSRVMGVRVAAVCTLIQGEEGRTLHALSLCDHGAMMDPTTYLTQCTPCEDVLLTGQACFREGVKNRFPEDEYLTEIDAESYVGVRLEDQQGGVLGLLTVMDDKPLDDGVDIETILRMFAPRTAAELDQLAISDRVRELTEDLEAEVEKRTQELGKANTIFQSLVARSTDGFCGVDADGAVTLVNPSLCEMLDRNVGDIVGKINVNDLVYPEDRDDFQTHRYKHTRQRTNLYHVRLLHADGRPVAFDVTSHAQVDDAGNHLGCFAVMTPSPQGT